MHSFAVFCVSWRERENEIAGALAADLGRTGFDACLPTLPQPRRRPSTRESTSARG